MGMTQEVEIVDYNHGENKSFSVVRFGGDEAAISQLCGNSLGKSKGHGEIVGKEGEGRGGV